MSDQMTMEVAVAVAQVVESEPNTLTTADRAELGRHEAVIKRGLATFVEVANALVAIREGKLYRGTHATFADYCRERWDFGKSHVYRLINAAEAADNLADLSPIGDISESALRPLTGLAPDQQREVYTQAKAEAGGNAPTAAQVEKAVARVRPPKPTPVPELAKPVYVEPVAAPALDPNRAGHGRDKKYNYREHEYYYPIKHGPAVMPAELVAAGYTLVDADGRENPDGKRGWRWRFGDEMGTDVSYGGYAIEAAREHYEARLAAPIPSPTPEPTPPADPIVANLIEASTITVRFTDSLRIATLAQLDEALDSIDGSADSRRFLAISKRSDLLLTAKQAAELEAKMTVTLEDRERERDELIARGEAWQADATPDPDELAAIAFVEAEVAEEDAERMERDAGRASFERAPTPGATPDVDNAARLEDAAGLLYALLETQNMARRLYGELTGRHTLLLPFDRAIEDMLPPLNGLIEVLEQAGAANR